LPHVSCMLSCHDMKAQDRACVYFSKACLASLALQAVNLHGYRRRQVSSTAKIQLCSWKPSAPSIMLRSLFGLLLTQQNASIQITRAAIFRRWDSMLTPTTATYLGASFLRTMWLPSIPPIRSQWWCALCLPHCAGGVPLHSYS
jgi:hypothetical protein